MEENREEKMEAKVAKKLYRSKSEKMLCGVCAGLGEYFNLDTTIVRLLMVLLGFTGYGIFIYIVAAVIMPDKPKDE